MLSALAAGLSACADELPTATHPATPVAPVTFEVRLPWSAFASNLRVMGGFGRPDQVGAGLLANQFAGKLDARTLARFPEFPVSVSVLDTLGTTRTDTLLTFIGANVLVQFDTTSATNSGPVFLRVDRVDREWDERSATWQLAIDSGGVRAAWSQPGGGPLVPYAVSAWDPSVGSNQAILQLDSLETAFLRDTAQDNRGLLITLETAGERLNVEQVLLQLQIVPSVNPDSVLFVELQPSQLTYIYTPEAAAPAANELRVGGVPAWRTMLTLGLPPTVPGPAAICGGTPCQVELTGDRINHAALLLTTRPGDPAFAPTDTTEIEVRGVIAPEFLPKSPLASPLYIDSIGQPAGPEIHPSAFQPGGGRVVELAITPLLRDLVAGRTGIFRPTPTIALMEVREPFSFLFGSFVGPGQVGAPILRLVITISDPVRLP